MILKVLDRGAFIGMGRYGLDHIMNTNARSATIHELVTRGYANQMLLSQDYCFSSDWHDDEDVKKVLPKWSMTYTFEEIIPDWYERGAIEKDIETMPINNPTKWFN
ncbi:hypothetical protein [Cytobacillus purgationiresistens]|uniref:Metal-dependent phosphotriesterase family hydrolase n=1 Tax=Cytobacillus purgationiresistens TaxID=863449 RepID=A0ABU0AI94_9BACI|nr:hypothetical protein [Cytobacillus purgationiresistens]MDQ0269795.1 putative metal-dependent phosphotriesterase family hydrolase [Cytobacillus purgationiresistens]